MAKSKSILEMEELQPLCVEVDKSSKDASASLDDIVKLLGACFDPSKEKTVSGDVLCSDASLPKSKKKTNKK